jgi:hypothetical protein
MRQLSQLLFSADGTIYNQTLILNDKFEVDPELLAQQGLVCHLYLKLTDRVLIKQSLSGAAVLRRDLGHSTARREPWVGRHVHPLIDLELQRYNGCLELDVTC